MTIRVAGVDEVGRGPLAGPVVAAAVILPDSFQHSEITDSKKLSKKKREELYSEIQEIALEWSIVSADPELIDQVNILQASLQAMSAAVRCIQADRVLVDGNQRIDVDIPQQTVIGGDRKHVQISAASILAKVWRDRKMAELDALFPGYGFTGHAGYPTKAHKAAIATIGPSAIHRASFRGVKEYWNDQLRDKYSPEQTYLRVVSGSMLSDGYAASAQVSSLSQ